MAYVHRAYHGGKNYSEQVTDEFLTCKLCQVPGFTQPKTLPCGHIFCCPCLARYVQVCGPQGSTGRQLRCPTCGQMVSLPTGGLGALSDNLFVDTQVDRLLRRHNADRGRDDTFYDISNYQMDGYMHATFPRR